MCFLLDVLLGHLYLRYFGSLPFVYAFGSISVPFGNLLAQLSTLPLSLCPYYIWLAASHFLICRKYLTCHNLFVEVAILYDPWRPWRPFGRKKITLWHSRKCLLSYMKRGFGPSQKHQLLAKLKPRRHPKCFQNPPKMEAKNGGAAGHRPATWPLVPRDTFFKFGSDFWPPARVPESLV